MCLCDVCVCVCLFHLNRAYQNLSCKWSQQRTFLNKNVDMETYFANGHNIEHFYNIKNNDSLGRPSPDKLFLLP